MSPDLPDEIVLELTQLNRLFSEYGTLLTKSGQVAPDRVELLALAALLHSFYTGVENIFKRIILHQEGAVPASPFWHKDLLNRMAQPFRNGPAAISPALQERLKDYLDFRHAFRQAYSFQMRWDRMAPLVQHCLETFSLLEKEMRAFLSQDPQA